MKDIGSEVDIQSYRGQGYEGAISGKCFCDFSVPESLRDGCALRGACRSRPMIVRGAPPADGRPDDAMGMGPGVLGYYPL